MSEEIINEDNESLFEQIKHINENGIEYWQARELSKALDYSDFRNFIKVLQKAAKACEQSKQELSDHVVEFNEMVSIGSGAEREIPSYRLSRYFCYLIVQNADSSKEVVALGQTYFATQTRLQELQPIRTVGFLNKKNFNFKDIQIKNILKEKFEGDYKDEVYKGQFMTYKYRTYKI